MDLKEFDALLHDAEVKLKRLKALYEQWFQGIERIEPQVARKDLERLFARLTKDKPRNTAARFRLQQLTARYAIYLTYWGRIARQIEEGTYERDLRRAQRARGAASPTGSAKTFELDLDAEIDLEELLEARDEITSVFGELDRPLPPPAPRPKPVLSAFSPFAAAPKKKKPAPEVAPAKAPPPPPPKPAKRPLPPSALGDRRQPSGPSPTKTSKPVTATFGKPKSIAPGPKTTGPAVPTTGGGDDARLRRLYDSYVSARRRNDESTDGVAYDTLASSVRRMTSKPRERHGDKNIDFEVVVQNGKVGIKPKIG